MCLSLHRFLTSETVHVAGAKVEYGKVLLIAPVAPFLLTQVYQPNLSIPSLPTLPRGMVPCLMVASTEFFWCCFIHETKEISYRTVVLIELLLNGQGTYSSINLFLLSCHHMMGIYYPKNIS